MATKAQIKANQQNAQKSTGPQTDEGKAVVSQNAVKHGLFAAEAVISGENPAVYELFRDEMLAELTPAGMLESVLAERIVSLSWRLQRAERMHNEAIDVMLARTETNELDKDMREDAGEAQEPPADGLEMLLGRATYDDFSNSRVLERLWIYERRIEYSLISTINKLQNYQFIRQIRESETRKAKPARPSLRPGSEPHLLFSKGLAQYLRDKVAGRRRKVEEQVDLKKQSRPSDGNTKYEALNPTTPVAWPDACCPVSVGKQVEMVHLKKQSQFEPELMGTTSFMQGAYGNNPAGGDEENKPNQSQINADEQAKRVGKRKKISRCG